MDENNEEQEVQTTFNEDSIDALVEDVKIENQTETETEEVTE